jgi:hypothetical protein
MNRARREMRTGYWWGKPKGKRPPGRPRLRWADNIKTDLRESIKTILELHIVFMNFKYINFPSDTIFCFLFFFFFLLFQVWQTWNNK